ncbi:MAG: HAD-IA family hydrolase [Actinomycetota bacterium]
MTTQIRAVLFDFGGVVTTSPFDAFASYEEANGLPVGLIRRINSTNPDDNAWAKLERSEVDRAGFAELFEAEAAAIGHELSGAAVLELLAGDLRPEMVEAIRRIAESPLRLACLTNNFRQGSHGTHPVSGETDVKSLFDHMIESAVIGIRKPEPEFYRRALEIVGVEASEAVFLDDLGINLKPAKAMGMTTIKVVDAAEALSELEAVIGLDLRG